MAFRQPTDSLYYRYSEAYRQFTWEGVQVPSGKKVLPKFRIQTRPNCIFVAIVTWMEASLRLAGRNIRLSVEDFEEKVNNLVGGGEDRTLDCIRVLREKGICSEDDYMNKVTDCVRYSVVGLDSSLALHPEHFKRAVESMETNPLLIVFHIDGKYYDYVRVFKQVPVLSYERYEEGKMEGHGCCGIGYGIEEVVPFWKFMNSVGKIGPTKGVGRVIPQNIYYLYWHNGVIMKLPQRLGKRRRQDNDADPDIDYPPTKKHKQDHLWLMDQDNVMP